MVRKRVKNLNHLAHLARERKSVVLPGIGFMGRQGYSPAAWALNMQGSMLCWMLREGIYIYEPKTGRKSSAQTIEALAADGAVNGETADKAADPCGEARG